MKWRLPPASRRLLSTLLDTFEKLEVAAELTRSAEPARLSELAARAQLSGDVSAAVAPLVDAELIVTDGAADPMLQLGARAARDDFAELMQLYQSDRIAVISDLCALSIDRIRGMAARTFADAFVLRRKKP